MPEHANNLGWSLGGLTATALVILIATGIVLTQYFNPMPEDANQSVRRIVTDVELGSFVRGVHFWAAQAMYVLAGLHLLRVFFTASYKRPREANWLIGVAMFGLVTGAIFTGTVIKWDQEGFEALAHNLEIGRLLGGAGFWFTAEFSGQLPLIVRLYVAHVAIIPGLILALLAIHFLLVKRHGISPHPAIPHVMAEPREPFTHHLRRLGAFGLALAGVLGVLAVLFPPGIGPTPVEGSRSPDRCGCSGGCSRSRTGGASRRSCGARSRCSRCLQPFPSSIVGPSAGGASARSRSVSRWPFSSPW
ncbi:MAG: cytochrome b N-terminal domain-containing protein [Acidimicrobiia bacterium]|nr:cytochrome b N-terminal domain-containing protein [Acidimicrobiia bacterium]